MPAGTQRIVFEVDVENVPEFQAELRRAADSLRDLAKTAARTAAEAAAGDAKIRDSNQSVSESYQRMAASAMVASSEQVAASDRVIAKYGEQAAAAQASADAQVAAAARVAAANTAAAAAMGAGGGGGGRDVNIAAAAAGGDGGGGGVSVAQRLGLGTGLFGLAGFGTVAGLAGLGAEHAITTVLALAGSLATAFGGLGSIAAGAFGEIAVGAGSDIAVLKATFTNVQTLNKALDNLSNAQAQYGANSKQAQTAQQALNGQMRILAADVGPAAARAELGVAQNLQNMADVFSHASAQAQISATQIMNQVIRLGTQFAPRVAQAAQQNLAIINNSLKPLFAWLQGPEGIQIFTHLEEVFRSNLPSAMHAFTQGVEFLARFINIASNYTGGFTTMLDRLFTRLNSLDNSQINQVVSRLVNDFRLWEHFVVLLTQDIVGLFRNAQGTGSSIIQTLNGMLERLHQWENSIQGRAQLTNIFVVHKREIDALLQALPLLVGAFAPLYMAVAPALTTAFTAVLKVFETFVHLIEGIPGGAFAVGMAFILARMKLLIPLVAALKDLMIGSGSISGAIAAFGGAKAGKAAAGAASGAAETAGGGILGGLAARAGSILPEGLVGGLASLGRLLIPGGALVLGLTALVKGLNLVPAPMDTARLSTGRLSNLLQSQGVSALNSFVGRQGGPTGLWSFVPGAQALVNSLSSSKQSVSDFLRSTGQGQQVLQSWVNQVDSMTKVSHLSTGQLQNLVSEGDALAKAFAGTKFEPIIQKFLKPLTHEAENVGKVFNTINDRWYEAATATLPRILDVYNTNIRLIDNAFGQGSARAVQAVRLNLQQMVRDTSQSMIAGKVSVKAGMDAISQAMSIAAKQGVGNVTSQYHMMFATLTTLYNDGKLKANAYFQYIDVLTRRMSTNAVNSGLAEWKSYIDKQHQMWLNGQILTSTYLQNVQNAFQRYSTSTVNRTAQSYSQMFAQLARMYDQHKINTQTLQSQVETIWKQGNSTITDSVNKAKQDQEAIWRQQAQDGEIKWSTYWQRIHTLNTQAGQQTHNDMAAWAAQIYDSIAASGKVTFSGAEAIWKELKSLIGPMGGEVPPHPTSVATVRPQINPYTSAGLGARARGGLFQVGHEGEAGRDNVPMNVGGVPIVVGAGEQVAVFNRHQQAVANQALADYGGLGGLFSRVNTPHYMAAGGYVYPIAPGVPIGRTDQGVDPLAAAGKPFGPIGNARIGETSGGGWPGGPFMSWQLTDGPMAGRWVYLAERIRPTVRPGQHVSAHQAVAVSTGPSQEMGWAAPGGAQTLARVTGGYSEGQQTAAGLSFRAFLTGLSHGKIVGGGLGFGTVTAPHVVGPPGTYTKMVQAGLNKAADVANTYAQKQLAALMPAGGTFAGSATNVGGPVAAQMFHAGTQLGLSKAAIAGMIGNAFQESSLNPNLNVPGGRGLFSWNPAGNPVWSSRVQLGNVAQQMTLAMQELSAAGLSIGDFNRASSSPAAAATWFEQNFEHALPSAANMPNRISAAQSAYAHGYKRGGPLLGMAMAMAAGGGVGGGSGGGGGVGRGGVGRGPGHGGHLGGGPGRLHHGHPVHVGDNVYDFLHWQSPGFSAKDLGPHWLGFLQQHMTFRKIHDVKMGDLRRSLEWVHDLLTGVVPRAQDRVADLKHKWSHDFHHGGMTKKRKSMLEHFDREIVSYLLWAAQELQRRRDPVADKIEFLRHHGKGSEVHPWLQAGVALDNDLKKIVGFSGVGGMLGKAEKELQHLVGGGPAGRQSQLMSLLEQKLQFASERNVLQRAEFKTLDGMIRQLASTLPGSGQLPAYQQGGPVLRTGLAMVHQGEYVIPARQTQGAFTPQPVDIRVLVEDGAVDPSKIRVIADGQIQRHAARTVSGQVGRRSRALHHAPGRPAAYVTR